MEQYAIPQCMYRQWKRLASEDKRRATAIRNIIHNVFIIYYIYIVWCLTIYKGHISYTIYNDEIVASVFAVRSLNKQHHIHHGKYTAWYLVISRNGHCRCSALSYYVVMYTVLV